MMPEQVKLQSDEVQLKKYRELAQMLRQWSEEPDDTDWSVIEAELNSAGMRCRDDETTSAKENVPHAPHV